VSCTTLALSLRLQLNGNKCDRIDAGEYMREDTCDRKEIRGAMHKSMSPPESQALETPGCPIRCAIVEGLLTEEEILARVREIGNRISGDYPDLNRPLLLVGVLKGAALFLADLVRAIQRPVEIDFVTVASYGAETHSSGDVRVLRGLDADVTGKDVIIVDDILDTGLTLRFSSVMENLRAGRASSVKVCVLLDKPARRQVHIDVEYRGFVIEDRFVVGYGMDYGEQYRNLPYIGVLVFES